MRFKVGDLVEHIYANILGVVISIYEAPKPWSNICRPTHETIVMVLVDGDPHPFRTHQLRKIG